jgi:hypothetical protein
MGLSADELLAIDILAGNGMYSEKFRPADGWPPAAQKAIDKQAERNPAFRPYASSKTWIGDHFSPGHCGMWLGLAEKADHLPSPDRDRAVELLRLRRMNYRLEPSEVDWLEAFLVDSGLDLGPEGEQPWLKDHLSDGFGPYEPSP